MTFRPNAEATRAFTRSLARSTDSLVTPGSLAQIKLGRWCDPGRRSSAVAAFSIEAKTPILAILPSAASTHGQNSTSIQNEKIVQGGWKPQEERPTDRACSPDMAARPADLGAVPGGEPPEKFTAFIQAETAKWTKVTRTPVS